MTSDRKDTQTLRNVKPPAGRADTKTIRICLIHRGWSVTELARRAGLPRSYTSDLIHGAIRRRRAQERIAHTLGLPFNEAFPETPR